LLNKTITVNISNLPSNIQKLVSHFAKSDRCPQLSVGPMEPNPGPTLPIADAEAVKAEVTSKPVIDNTIAVKTKITI
jgi:hypothetical protein